MSRVSRAEVSLGAPPVIDVPVESEPTPAPVKASKAAAKPTESEEPSA